MNLIDGTGKILTVSTIGRADSDERAMANNQSVLAFLRALSELEAAPENTDFMNVQAECLFPQDVVFIERADGQQFMEMAQAQIGVGNIGQDAPSEVGKEQSVKETKEIPDLDELWGEIKTLLDPDPLPVVPPPVPAPTVQVEVSSPEPDEDKIKTTENEEVSFFEEGWFLPNWIWAPSLLLFSVGGSGGSSASSTVVEPVQPIVNSVAITSAEGEENGYLNASDVVTVTVIFDRSVEVNTSGGTPSVTLTIGNATKQASYVSGTGSASLSFSYTLEAGLEDTNGISIGVTALALNGAQIVATDGGGSAIPTHLAVADNADYKVDNTAPTITITTPIEGDDRVSAAEDGDVVVSGTTDGAEDGRTVTITFTDESNATITKTTNVLSDAWTLAGSEADISALDNGTITVTGTVSDEAGNSATPASANITLDTLAPTILRSSPSFGSYLNASEDDSDASFSVLTTGVEDGQVITLSLGADIYTAAVTNNAASVTLPAAALQAFSPGTIAYTLDVSDAANQAADTLSASFTYDAAPPVVAALSSDGTEGAAKIVFTMSEAIDPLFSPLRSDFTVKVGGVANNVDDVSVSGQTIELTLASGFSSGSLVNVVYTQPDAGSGDVAQDLAGNPMSGFAKGVLSDGYIRGAQIYLDADADGIADASEILAGTVTDRVGNFFISSDANPNNYAIIAVGGVNVDTGVVNTTPLGAPAGSTAVNPISTLVQSVISNGDASDATAASAIIASALGLEAGTDLTAFDPISEINSGTNPGAIAAQKAAVQIVMIVALAAVDDNADAAASKGGAILYNIASSMMAAARSQSVIDFSSTETITSAIGDVVVSEAVQNTISLANTAIRELPEDTSVLTNITKLQSEYLDTIAPNAPTGLIVDSPTNNTRPDVRISLDTSDQTGRAVVAGDTLFLLDGETLLESKTITSDDMTRGYVDLILSVVGGDSYNLSAYLVDQAQNRSEMSDDIRLLLIDTTAPTTQLSTSVDGLSPGTSVQMTIVFDEEVVGFSLEDISLEAGQVSNLSAPTLLANKSVRYTFDYTAPVVEQDSLQITLPSGSYTDLAGNVGLVSNTIDLRVDSPPSVTISNDLSGVATGPVVYSFNFSEAVSGFSQDDITFSGGTGSDFTILSPALYTFTVTPTANSTTPILVSLADSVAVDASGQGNSSASANAQTVDTAAPLAPIVNFVAVDDEISDDEKTAGVDVSGTVETGAEVKIIFSGEARVVLADQVTGQWSYSFSANDFSLMGEGAETLTVTATDEAGNESNATVKNIVIDTKSPVFGLGQTFAALDLYSYYADADPFVVYQASVTALSRVTYSLVDNTSPFSVNANTGSVFFDPDSEAAVIDNFIARPIYDLDDTYSLTLRATDLYGNFKDHSFQFSVLPRVNALAMLQATTGDMHAVITDQLDGFRVDYVSPSVTQAFQADLHFDANGGEALTANWHASFSDNIYSVDLSSSGVASPRGEDDPLVSYVQSGANGEGVVRIGALTWVAENAVQANETLLSLDVTETDSLFPTWIVLDQIILEGTPQTDDWMVELVYGSFMPDTVLGSSESEWFDIMGTVSISSGDGADILSYNYFTPSQDVAITDFTSGQDIIDFSPAMNRLGYVSQTGVDISAADSQLRVHIVEAEISDTLLAQLADILELDTASATLAALDVAVEADGLAANTTAAALLDNALVGFFDQGAESLLVFADLNATAGVTEIATTTWSLASKIFDPEDLNVLSKIVL